MHRRDFLRNAAGGLGSLSTAQFLTYFANFGLPATGARAAQMAADAADAAAPPRLLVYWFVEGGWMGYDMFNPVMTPNHVVKRLEAASRERYRVLKWGEDEFTIKSRGNIRYGYLAEEGKELFPEMAVLSSMYTGSFHSGERLRAHYGDYPMRYVDDREEDERTVMQAFSEAYGQPYLLPHLSWHWWLSDGELNEVQYSGRKGYYHALGPAHAHTIYAGTPAKLRRFLMRMHENSADAVNARVEEFLGGLEGHLLDDSSNEAVRSYRSARSIYESLAARGRGLDPALVSRLFEDSELRAEFEVKPADEVITYRSINGNKARSKFTPATNVQAMMAYELARAGYSCAFWIESRGIRDFDDHYTRRGLWKPDGSTPVGLPDTTGKMREDLWKPLKTFVKKLKATEHKDTGKSLWDLTTVVLTSEFGRTIHGDVEAIEKMPVPESEKRALIGDQDICQHWPVTSAAFLGAGVKGDAQYGRVGEHTLMPIPILPDGSLDPAYDPVTGVEIEGRQKSEHARLPNHGDVYSTALALCGLNPKGRGRNQRPPLEFIKKA